MTGHKLLALFNTIRDQLAKNETVRVPRAAMLNYLPMWWPEEADSVEEWFVRMGRNLGFHVTWDPTTGRFVVRMVKSEVDQSTIALPGVDNMASSPLARRWGGHEQ